MPTYQMKRQLDSPRSIILGRLSHPQWGISVAVGDTTASQRQSPPSLRPAMWSFWASCLATVVVVATVVWHSRQTHPPGSSLAALEVIFQVLVTGVFAFTYWRLQRSLNWRLVQDGPQGVRADTLAVFTRMISLAGVATAGCAIWFWSWHGPVQPTPHCLAR